MADFLVSRRVREWNFANASALSGPIRPRRLTVRAAAVVGLLMLMIAGGGPSPAARRPAAAIRQPVVLATHNDPVPPSVPVISIPELISKETSLKCKIWGFNTATWRSRHTFEEHVWKASLPTPYAPSAPGRPPGQFNPGYFENPKPGDLNYKDTNQRGSGPATDYQCR